MTTTQNIIISIVEGLTEFLPVSSTGHMIITEKILKVTQDDFSKVFTIAIQLGAILAVVVLYWKKFFNFKNWQFYVKIAVGVVPALLMGFLLSDKIEGYKQIVGHTSIEKIVTIDEITFCDCLNDKIEFFEF